MIDILFSAFLLSVILLGIHSFFGLEIIKRGIIFTDLAIGQMSAVGAAISILVFHGEYIYPISLGFALLAGLVISIASRKTDRLEAFIGLLYALSISSVYILLSYSTHGKEIFNKLMATDILYTPMRDILVTGGIYAIIGIALFFLYRRLSGFKKDLFFYLAFAATVTSSVKLAGVLIVFALLVAPALISLRIGKGNLLINSWIIGTVVNLLAIFIFHAFDLPAGYTIVFCQAFCAILIILILPKKEIVPDCKTEQCPPS